MSQKSGYMACSMTPEELDVLNPSLVLSYTLLAQLWVLTHALLAYIIWAVISESSKDFGVLLNTNLIDSKFKKPYNQSSEPRRATHDVCTMWTTPLAIGASADRGDYVCGELIKRGVYVCSWNENENSSCLAGEFERDSSRAMMVSRRRFGTMSSWNTPG